MCSNPCELHVTPSVGGLNPSLWEWQSHSSSVGHSQSNPSRSIYFTIHKILTTCNVDLHKANMDVEWIWKIHIFHYKTVVQIVTLSSTFTLYHLLLFHFRRLLRTTTANVVVVTCGNARMTVFQVKWMTCTHPWIRTICLAGK